MPMIPLLTLTAMVTLALPHVGDGARPIRDRPNAAACPIGEGQRGYPIAVTPGDESVVDTAFLSELTRALAYRWRVPSSRRGLYTGWERVRNRLRTPEPRWADDWKPDAKHRARLTLVLYKGARRPLITTIEGSGDKRFDASLESMALQPMPGAPRLPALPPTADDSLRVDVHVGMLPSPSAPYTEFAIQQAPVRLVPGSLRVDRPASSRSPRATVKYDVSEDGLMISGSFEVLESSDPAFGQAIEEALSRARFVPAESNCRRIAMTVVQTFDG